MFDSGKKGSIEKEKVRTILNTLGQAYNEAELEALLDENDSNGKYSLLKNYSAIVEETSAYSILCKSELIGPYNTVRGLLNSSDLFKSTKYRRY